LLFVVDGQVQVDPTGGAQTRLATHGATVLKPGTSARLTDASDRPAHLLEVIVTPTSPTARTRPHLEPV
jgi:hypothetical protein